MENVFGMLVTRFRALLGTMALRPKVIRDIAQYAEDTARQSKQGNEPVYVPNENYRNPSREAKHQ